MGASLLTRPARYSTRSDAGAIYRAKILCHLCVSCFCVFLFITHSLAHLSALLLAKQLNRALDTRAMQAQTPFLTMPLHRGCSAVLPHRCARCSPADPMRRDPIRQRPAHPQARAGHACAGAHVQRYCEWSTPGLPRNAAASAGFSSAAALPRRAAVLVDAHMQAVDTLVEHKLAFAVHDRPLV